MSELNRNHIDNYHRITASLREFVESGEGIAKEIEDYQLALRRRWKESEASKRRELIADLELAPHSLKFQEKVDSWKTELMNFIDANEGAIGVYSEQIRAADLARPNGLRPQAWSSMFEMMDPDTEFELKRIVSMTSGVHWIVVVRAGNLDMLVDYGEMRYEEGLRDQIQAKPIKKSPDKPKWGLWLAFFSLATAMFAAGWFLKGLAG